MNHIKDYNDHNGGLKDYYIISFSRDEDSRLMWSNYSNQNGINIQFDFGSFYKSMSSVTNLHGLVD